MQAIVNVLNRDRLIYLIMAGMLIYIYSITGILNIQYTISAKGFLGNAAFIECLTLAVLVLAYPIKLFREGVKSPISAIISKIRGVIQHPAELVAFIGVNLALIAFVSGFSFIKSMIPAIKPFAYDPFFTSLDKALHFGVPPWEITHAIFSHPIATAVINFLYNLWFFLFWGITFFFVIRTKILKDREQYLVTYFFCWLILGGFFATALSSVGPIFYGRLIEDGIDPYMGLMDTLRMQDQWLRDNGSPVNVWSLGIADGLWERYVNSETVLGSGISAMPSMHLSMATLMALGMRRISKVWGIIFWFYVGVIQIGSVHLAWHYAIDGYFSILATTILWLLVGRLIAHKYSSQESEQEFVLAT